MVGQKWKVQRGLDLAKYALDDSLIPEEKNKPKRIRAFGYIRVSTKQQAGEDRMGEQVQKENIEKYAVLNGYEIVDWYIDEISGVKEDRPAFNEILYGDDCDKRNIEAVIAYKSDRIARDIKLYFYYLYCLEKKNVKLLSVTEQFEDDQFGLSTVYRTLMLFVAEQERRNIMLRTSGGRKTKAAQGGYAGGKVPYGYKSDRGRLEVNEDEAAVVKIIFKLREAGCSLTEITDQLNWNGYRTRSKKEFTTSHISRILNNRPTYEGYYKYGDGKWVLGQHQAIMPKHIRKIPEVEMLNAELRAIVETGTSDPTAEQITPELNDSDRITEDTTLISEVSVPAESVQDNIEDKQDEPDPVIEDKPVIGADFDEMFAADIPEPESEESKPESDVNPKSTIDYRQADPLAMIRRGVSYGGSNRGVI